MVDISPLRRNLQPVRPARRVRKYDGRKEEDGNRQDHPPPESDSSAEAKGNGEDAARNQRPADRAGRNDGSGDDQTGGHIDIRV